MSCSTRAPPLVFPTVSLAVTGAQNCYWQGSDSTSATGQQGQATVELVIVCQRYSLSVTAGNLTAGQIVVSDGEAGDANLAFTPGQPAQTFTHAFLPPNPYDVTFASASQNCNFVGVGNPNITGEVTGEFTSSGNVDLQLECQ